MNNIYPIQVIALAKKYGIDIEETMYWYNFYDCDLEMLEEILPLRKIGRTPTLDELRDCLGVSGEFIKSIKLV